jgi:pimeloyl-ACP methyl ester carboxylesterase
VLLALHGLPTSPALWARVPLALDAPSLPGVDDDTPFDLDALVARTAARLSPGDVVIGHDLGGLVAARVALATEVAAVVLTGTALGPYWAMVRATARPPVDRYFYDRHGGRKFLAGSVSPVRRDEAIAAFPPVPPDRMRAIARAMRPPPGLAQRLAQRTRVHLVWGRRDRWYPPVVARALARATGATVRWLDAGHLCMWEEPEAFAAAVRAAIATGPARAPAPS